MSAQEREWQAGDKALVEVGDKAIVEVEVVNTTDYDGDIQVKIEGELGWWFPAEYLRPVPAAEVVEAATDDVSGRAKVVTLCGSTRFKDQFHAENQRLTMEGNVVISLGVYGHTDLPDYDWTTDASDLKHTLDGLHFQKIDMADAVHVIDVDGYVGESTAREIAYAERRGIPVTYMSKES